MRILVTAAPFHGHVNAVLPMARAAHGAGHDVVVATGADLAADVSRRGLTTWSIGPTSTESGVPQSLTDFWESAAVRAADLLPLAAAWRPDVVIAEELELAGPVLAARHNCDLLVHDLGIAATGDPEQFADDLDHLGGEWGVESLSRTYLDATRLSICPPALQPPSAGTTRRVVRLRPGLGEPAPGERLPAAVEALPYSDTVHLTLGTVFHRRRPGAMQAAIAGLRELPVNLVVTVGPQVDPDSFGPQPPHVLLASYLPHALLLPRCRLVVSQGGAGILLGALAHGLPQLVLPQGADQFHNATAVVQAGVALSLDHDQATPVAIADATNQLLTEPGFTTAALNVRDEITAMPNASDVVQHLFGQPCQHQG